MRSGSDARLGLIGRTVMASGLLALLMGLTFVLLFGAITGLRDSARLASRSETALASVNRLERLVVDLETGQRGFIITRDESFLAPWQAARSEFPKEAATLRRIAAEISPAQRRLADRIAQVGTAYIQDYCAPLVAEVRKNPAAAGITVATGEGKRRTDAIRADFERFVHVQHQIVAVREGRTGPAADRAAMIAVAGAMASFLLVLLFVGYLMRAVVRPVRRASVMACGLAGGDLGVRMPETSVAEIGELEHVFNSMAGSLEAGQEELRRVAEEQGALRRIATLVARGVSPADLFSAVAGERSAAS